MALELMEILHFEPNILMEFLPKKGTLKKGGQTLFNDPSVPALQEGTLK